MINPKVTVAVANYNQGRYLGQCLDSLKNQTFDDYEVIVIDDGSTDGSYNVIVEHRWEKLRFRNYSNNLGLPTALNFAVEDARGDFFVRLDADDIAMPTFVSDLYRECCVSLSCSPGRNCIPISYSNYIECSSNEIKLISTKETNLISLQASGVMLPIYVIKDMKYNNVFWEEYDLLLRIFKKHDPMFMKTQSYLWVYRKHSDNMTNDFYKILYGWKELIKLHGAGVVFDNFRLPKEMVALL